MGKGAYVSTMRTADLDTVSGVEHAGVTAVGEFSQFVDDGYDILLKSRTDGVYQRSDACVILMCHVVFIVACVCMSYAACELVLR